MWRQKDVVEFTQRRGKWIAIGRGFRREYVDCRPRQMFARQRITQRRNIGLEVAGKLIKYSDNGSTLSAVNFPEVSLPLHGGRRLMHIHENRPGVLTALNKIFAEQGVNIAAQYLQTSAQMGYVVIDIEADEDVAEKALQAMKAIPGTIRARLLY